MDDKDKDIRQVQILQAMMPLQHAGLANPPANQVEFFKLAARMLVEFSPEVIGKAVTSIVRDATFWPKISEIRRAAEQVTQANRAVNHSARELARLAGLTQHLADKNPVDWTPADHAEFERIHGRPVWWKGQPFNCPVLPEELLEWGPEQERAWQLRMQDHRQKMESILEVA